jgi:hypothetical protein
MMSARVKKIHPALKHGGYAATALLPGEDPAAFEKLHQDLIAELRPDGPLENEIVVTIVRLTWRKRNLETLRIAESARKRYSVIRSEKVPSTEPPFQFYPLLDPDPDWDPPDPAEVKAAQDAAETQARKELGDRYIFVEIGEVATISRMFEDFEVEERLQAMIERCIKQLFHVKGLKSLTFTSPSALRLEFQDPRKLRKAQPRWVGQKD